MPHRHRKTQELAGPSSFELLEDAFSKVDAARARGEGCCVLAEEARHRCHAEVESEGGAFPECGYRWANFGSVSTRQQAKPTWVMG